MDKDDEELRNFIMEKGILGITESNLDSKIRLIMSRRAIGEKEVALVIQFLSTQKKMANHDTIMKVMKETLVDINWIEVFSHMDNMKFCLEKPNLINMIELWKSINKENTFPYNSFFKKWKNSKSQLNFINTLIESDEINNIYNNVFLTRILKEDKERKYIKIESNFNCVELFSLIRELNYITGIKKIYQKSPQWCLVGLILISPFANDLFRAYLLPKIQDNDPVLFTLFCINKNILITQLSNSSLELAKIHNICITQKMLPYIAEVLVPPFFSFELIFLSCRKNLVDLNVFISNALNTKKEVAANALINYFMEKFKQVERGIIKEEIRRENEYFPLNYDLIVVSIQALEQHIKHFNRETNTTFNKFKGVLPAEVKNMIDKKNNYENEANNFIGSIVSGNRTVTEGISALSRFSDRGLLMKIYSLVIDNYSNFQKIKNKKEIASFYGKLLEYNILPSFYSKRLLNSILLSLKNNKSSADYSFGLRVLEVFSDNIDLYPHFKADIEKIESVKDFINEKKNIYILEEALLTEVSLNELLDIILPVDSVNLKDSVNWNEIERLVIGENVDNRRNVNINENLIIRYILEEKVLIFDQYNLVRVILGLNLYDKVLKYSFELINHLLNFKLGDEINYIKKLGELIGKITIGRDTIMTINVFDVKEFFIKAIKNRRSKFFIYFIISFLHEGNNSLIFRPKNPYIMRLLFMLNEIYEYSEQDVKKDINEYLTRTLGKQEIKKYDNTEKLLNIIKEYTTLDASKVNYLTNYKIEIPEKVELEQILKYIIGMAIDFSIKEITFIIEDKIKKVSLKASDRLLENKTIKEKLLGVKDFNRKLDMLAENIEKIGTAPMSLSNEDIQSLKAILKINMIKSLVHVSAHEPIRASICGNITHFIKLANLTLDTNYTQKIAEDNLHICCEIITRHTVRNLESNVDIDYSNPYISSINLFNSVKYEKLSLEPLKFTEYNEIKERLIQISKKNPRKSVVRLKNEWDEIEEQLNNEYIGHNLIIENINTTLSYVKNSCTPDNLAELLAKRVISYILKNNSKNIEYMMYTLCEIFKFSFKTQSSVLMWIIYSKDERKFNVTLFTQFIKYNFININELDTNISRLLRNDKYLSFIVILLRKLILEYTCSPYEFIKSIEALCKVNEDKFDVRIYNLLRYISKIVIEGKTDSNFEAYLLYYKTLVPELPISITKEFIYSSLSASWDIFLKYYKVPSLYAYNGIDYISYLLAKKEYLVPGIEGITDLLLKSIQKENLLFQRIYSRFIYNIIKIYNVFIHQREDIEEIKETESLASDNSFLSKINTNLDFNSKEEDYEILRNCYLTRQLMNNSYNFKKENAQEGKGNTNIPYIKQQNNFNYILYLRNNSKNNLLLNNLSEFFSNQFTFKNIITELLLTISPRNVPSFTASYIYLCTNDLIFSLTDKPLFYISKEILFVLKYLEHKDNLIISLILTFFSCLKKYNNTFFNNYSIYLSYYTHPKFHILKNMFNKAKKDLDKSKDIDKKDKLVKRIIGDVNNYYNVFILLSSTLLDNTTITTIIDNNKTKDLIRIIVDNIYDNDMAYKNVKNIINILLEKDLFLNDLLVVIIRRIKVGNAPELLKTMLRELIEEDKIKKKIGDSMDNIKSLIE